LSLTLTTRIRIAKKFFDMIHRIELKGTYSEIEIDYLLKDLERLNHDEWEELRLKLDMYYRDKDDLMLRKLAISRLRTIFHRVLKDAGQNPLE